MYRLIARRIFAALLPAAFTLVSTAAYANDPPKAVASTGGDPVSGEVLHSLTRYVGPADNDGVSVTVSGAGSSDPDGDNLRYLWQCVDDNGNKCP
jgi:Ni,Fe-hydrogenase III small subunit